MNSRTILSIVMIVILVAILSVGAYFLFLKKPASTAVTGQTGTLPATGNQTITPQGTNNGTGPSLVKSFGVISPDPAVAYAVNAQNNVFIVEPNGEIEEVTNGTPTVISSGQIPDIISATFSFDDKKILVSSGVPQNPTTKLFDVAAKTWTPLSQGWLSPHWAPSDYRIGYFQSANRIETLSTLDISSSKSRPVKIMSLDAENLSFAWLNKNQVMLYDQPSALTVSSAWMYDLQKAALTPIAIESPGFESMWSADSTSTPETGLAFLTGSSQTGGQLELINPSGSNLQSLNFLTLPSKCAFTTSFTPAPAPTTAGTGTKALASSTKPTAFLSLYCAVPRDQQAFSSAQLPDAYDQKVIYTADNFYDVNTKTGGIQTIFADQTQNFDASDVQFTNNTIFFINRYDQKLYGIELNAS